jgi:hypothetical protein
MAKAVTQKLHGRTLLCADPIRAVLRKRNHREE